MCEETDELCECADYLVFTEPPYDEKLSMGKWCGQPLTFTSQSRVLVITYFYRNARENVFKLNYSSKSKRSAAVFTDNVKGTVFLFQEI